MVGIPRTVILFFGLFVTVGIAAPMWTSDQTVKHINDKVIVVTCRGEGLVKDLSFRQALSQCNSIAADEANNQFQSKTVIVETESQHAKFHYESYSNKMVVGLTPKTEKEFTEQTDGSYVTHLQVQYDLSKAKVVSIDDQDRQSDDSENQPTATIVEKNSGKAPSTIKIKKLVQSDNRTILVTTIPMCKDVIIRGNRPRTQECANPMQLMVTDGDTEIILRPPIEFLPKTLSVKKRNPANGYDTETVEVQFERK